MHGSSATGRLPWLVYFLNMAKAVSLRSEDESTQVGCVIVGPNNEVRSTGYNGFPRQVKRLPHRAERPQKYKWTCHAEENAVTQAARHGTPLEGCAAYTTHFPCASCTRIMIQAGIAKVVCPMPNEDFVSRWEEDIGIAECMAGEAGMVIYKAKRDFDV